MQQISGRDHDCMGTGLVFLLSAIHSIFDVAWRLQTKETGPYTRLTLASPPGAGYSLLLQHRGTELSSNDNQLLMT
jgi:hypothetical protein